MYMTRVVIKRLPPPKVIHGILSSAFPGKRNAQINETLWRIDAIGDARVMIIVSTSAPDLQEIASQMGFQSQIPPDGEAGAISDKTIDYQPFLSRIENRQVWNFRLCANPVEHVKQTPADKRGKVYALRSIEEQLGWLDRQGDTHGFTVNGCSVIGDSWIAFDKVRIRSVTFDGQLTVTDADTFRSALTQGIGRGKAFGCGLLTVARVQA